MIDIDTIDRYRKAQKWSARELLQDALAELTEAESAQIIDLLSQTGKHEQAAVCAVADILRDRLVKLYGSDADHWDYDEQQSISDAVSRELRIPPEVR
jgi:predicted NBD/HSP70 family sugar kinase